MRACVRACVRARKGALYRQLRRRQDQCPKLGRKRVFGLASNVGEGAQTLHSMFKLNKVNATSGDLKPLDGDDLEAFVKDMEGLRPW